MIESSTLERAAAATRKAADDWSPGTVAENPSCSDGALTVMVEPSTLPGAPAPLALARCDRGSPRARSRRWCPLRPAPPARSRPSPAPRAKEACSRWPRRSPPSIVIGACPSVVRTTAPISRSGAATRSIGRPDRLSSPIRVDGEPRCREHASQQPHRRAGVAAVQIGGRLDEAGTALTLDLKDLFRRLEVVGVPRGTVTLGGSPNVAGPSLECRST